MITLLIISAVIIIVLLVGVIVGLVVSRHYYQQCIGLFFKTPVSQWNDGLSRRADEIMAKSGKWHWLSIFSLAGLTIWIVGGAAIAYLFFKCM